MKSRQVIGFKPEQGFAEEFEKLVNDLGVKKAELLEQAVLVNFSAGGSWHNSRDGEAKPICTFQT